ncbi:DsbA family protein [Shewanella waksmanii]|uniref:DsbA family protein n=1 Tax=Shewanella waksmanii TaxID=213783 RepID=UPI003736A0B5
MTSKTLISTLDEKTTGLSKHPVRVRLLLGTVLLLGLSLSVLLTQGLLAPSVNAQQAPLTDAQQQSVREIVEQMLVEDPQLLKRAIIALQQRENQTAQQAQQQALNQQHQALFDSKLDPWKGAENPEVTIAYFTDFNCPYCKKLEPELNRLVEDYPQLKVIVKMVPLQGEGSEKAVDLAQTVWLNEPEKYLAVKDTLMASPRRLDDSSIAKVADLTQTNQWLAQTDPQVNQIVANNLQLMRELGIGGTPAIIIGDNIIPGLVSYEVLKQHLDQYIEAND